MGHWIIITILSAVILFLLYLYIQAKKTICKEGEKINESGTLFNAILQHIKAYILIIDRDFVVEKTNYYTVTRAEEKQERKRVGELIQCIHSLQHGCGNGEYCRVCRIRQAIIEAFQAKKSFSNLEVIASLRVSEKTTTTCNISVSGSYMEAQDHPRMLITIHDITECKQAKIRLQNTLDKTGRIEKSKFSFLKKLGDDINDQLNCIMGWANLVSTDKTLTKEQHNEYMHLIYEHSDQLSRMTNNVLNLAKINTHNIDIQATTFYLHEFCQDIVLVHKNNTHPNVALILEGDQPKALVHTDQQKLFQVIVNLLSNAQKFTNKGHIKLAYSLNKEQDTIDFIVEDTGKGIPSKIHAYLFERFHKANTFMEGPGLGLSICKAYVEALGGTMQFTSAEGRGTRFQFSIQRKPIPLSDARIL